MTSQTKIEANRLNAQKSTGPRSVPGKSGSSGNSRTHGLTAGPSVEESIPGFAARLAEWEAEIGPKTVEARAALRQAVAATFRMERCESAYWSALSGHRARAREAWDVDRMAGAAELLGKLARRPEVVAPRLRTSSQGSEVMLRLWSRLGEALDAKAGEWNDDEISTACDLLGIPTHLRDGRLPFDPIDPGATDRHQCRREFVYRESGRLREAMEDRLTRLDDLERSHAESGASAMGAAPVRLVLRYEAMARRWYEKSLAVARAPGLAEASADDAPPPLFDPIAEPSPSRADPSPPPRESEAALQAVTADDQDRLARIALVESFEASLRATRSPSSDDIEAIHAESDAEAEPALPSGHGLNRHQRRKREALSRRA